MGRPLPPGLSDPDRLALSQFLAGHLSAGQLSERLQRTEQRSEPSSERQAKHGRGHRRLQPAAVGAVVAAIAIAAVAFAISSRPHVVAAPRPNTGHSQAAHRSESSRVVSDAGATSSSPRSSSLSSGERITVFGASRTTAQRPKPPKRNRLRFRGSKPRHVRGSAPPASTVTTRSSTGAGGSTTTVGTPTGTTPTETAPTGIATPPGTTLPGGATGSG